MLGERVRSHVRMYQNRNLYGTQLLYQVNYMLKYRRRRMLIRKLSKLLFWANLIVIGLLAWTLSCEPKAHVTPRWQKQDISEALKRQYLTAEDYQLLYRQTGMSPGLIDSLRSQNRQEEIYAAQEAYFRPVQTRCDASTILTRQEYLVNGRGEITKGMRIPEVEDGDILITFCSHCLGWRNGHAAIVIDAEKRLILEAQMLGSPSKVTSLERWEYYPSFLVLRLKGADEETCSAIAEYAQNQLVGIPYQLTARTNTTVKEQLQQEWEAVPEGTQCAHLVWFAYYQFGYDIDSNGAWLVTPEDIAESELLEVVQSYGMPL